MRIADPRASLPQLALWPEPDPGSGVRVRHSRRAHRVAVRVSAAGAVELVVPAGMSERRAWAFFESRAEWVRQHVARRRVSVPPPQQFPPRQFTLGLTGESWRLFQAGGRGRPRMVATAGVLELRGEGSAAAWHRCLLDWLRRRARDELGARLAAAATRHGFTWSAMTIRLQKTRWGSCSARGVISLNLALLFQSEAVVHYLLCHELAHTRHMNHSARFWSCVERCEPRWRELDAELTAGWRNVPAWVAGLQ